MGRLTLIRHGTPEQQKAATCRAILAADEIWRQGPLG